MGRKDLYIISGIYLIGGIALSITQVIERVPADRNFILAGMFLAAGMLFGILGIIASKGK